MRISDWSSDVCSSDLTGGIDRRRALPQAIGGNDHFHLRLPQHAPSLPGERHRDAAVGQRVKITRGALGPRGIERESRAVVGDQGGQQTRRRLVFGRRGGRVKPEERRGGKAGGSRWRARWTAYLEKKKDTT